MKTITNLLLIILSIFTTLLPFKNAEATFPGFEIAHWRLNVSDDRKDKDYLQIQKLVGMKKFPEAMAIIERKIKQSKRKATPIILKAMLLNEMGDHTQAIKNLMQGSQLERQHPAIHFGHCQIYRNLGEVELSDRGCKIAIGQHPDNPQTHYEYARTLAAMGEMKQAVREYAKAAELDPENPIYPYEQGMGYFYLNQIDDAIKSFQKTLEIKPEDFDSAYQLSYIYVIKKDKEKALAHLNKIRDLNRVHPKFESARILLKYVNENKFDQFPSKVDPAQYHFSKSQAHFHSGKFGLSLFEIQTAAKINPNDEKIQEILVGMSSLLLRLQLTEKSVNVLIKLGKDKPQLQAKGYQELGDIFVIRGDLVKAKKYYEKSRELGDPNKLAQISLDELPDPNSAKGPKMREKRFNLPAGALNRKGEIFGHFGMHVRALSFYATALKMDPSHLLSKLNTATTYFHMKKYGQSIGLLERILISKPQHEYIVAHRLLLAKNYAMNGDTGPALKNLEILKSLNKDIGKLIKKDPAFNELKSHDRFKQLFN